MRQWTEVEYRIVVPSRKREHNMKTIGALLPTAYICVEDSEVDSYARVWPRERVWGHPPLKGMGAIREWMYRNNPVEGMVQVDDDLKAVRCKVGRKMRTITDPLAIQQIFETSMQVCKDLGISVFAYSRDPTPLGFMGSDPFALVGPMYNAVGTIGKHLWYDEASGREDFDFTLRALLIDRIVFQDERYYFDVGENWTGKGGWQGIRTSDLEDRDIRELRRRWGQYCAVGMSTKRGTPVSRLHVKRKASDVVRG